MVQMVQTELMETKVKKVLLVMVVIKVKKAKREKSGQQVTPAHQEVMVLMEQPVAKDKRVRRVH